MAMELRISLKKYSNTDTGIINKDIRATVRLVTKFILALLIFNSVILFTTTYYVSDVLGRVYILYIFILNLISMVFLLLFLLLSKLQFVKYQPVVIPITTIKK